MAEQAPPSPNQRNKNSLTEEDLQDWYQGLVNMAAPHLERFGLEPLPMDMSKGTGQHPLEYSLPGLNLPISETIEQAELMQTGYTAEIERLSQDPEVSATINQVIKLLDNNCRFFTVVRHGDLLDLPLAALAIRDLASIKKGRLEEPYPTDLVISPAMSIVPGAITNLSQFTNKLVFMLPPTENSRRATEHIDDELLARYKSGELRNQVLSARRGGTITALAPKGTTSQGADLPEGVVSLLKRGSTLLVNVIFPNGSDQQFRIEVGQLATCTSREEVEAALGIMGTRQPTGLANLGTVATGIKPAD